MTLRALFVPCAVMFTLLTSGVAGAVSYATDFSATESPISEGGAWKHTGLDWTRVSSAGGLAYGTQTGAAGFDDSYAYLSGFPPDQSASGVVHIDAGINLGTTHEVEILLRWADSAHGARGYECNFAFNGQYADIVRWNGAKGDFKYIVPSLTASIPGGLHDGDTVSAKIVGHTITTFVNGTQILSVTDDTFNDGNPGIGFWRGAPSEPMNDFAFTRFAATSLQPESVAVPVILGWPTVGVLLALIGAGCYIVRRKRGRAAPRVG